MKALPKTIRPHTPVAYRIRTTLHYGDHTPSCARGRKWVEVACGYDHEQQVFLKRRVAVHQIVALGEKARKPVTPEDFLVNGNESSDLVKKVEAIKKRYPKNFQPRDRSAACLYRLETDREIEFHMTEAQQRRWLKQSEKRRNNSPLPPADKREQPKAQRIVRKNQRKRYHKAVSLQALIKSR